MSPAGPDGYPRCFATGCYGMVTLSPADAL